MDYVKIPVIYVFEIYPDSKEFMSSYLESINFSKISNYNHVITVLDARIEYKSNESVLELLMLLEAKIHSKQEIAEHLKLFLNRFDKFFKIMSDNFKNSFSVDKRVYL